MHITSMGRRARLAIATGAVAVAFAVPGAALADTTGGAPPIQPAVSRNATIQVTSVAVIAKLVANVTIAYTCQPFEVFDWETGQTIETTVGRLEDGGATIIQAQGKTIAWGQSGGFFGATAVCDGSTVNTIVVPVTAAVAPWKNGTAVVGASVDLVDENGFTSDFATTGPLTVRLAH